MKTAVITGGNSGIGKAVATALAKQGYRVIVHGRDPQKTSAAVKEITETSGNKNVIGISKDVSTIKGMKELAKEIREKVEQIEVLVLSTGVILSKHTITEDGLELGFAIQYLSRFAVTHLLMPELIKGQARVVVVGAPKLKNAAIFFEDLALKNNFTMVRAMGQEMYANHLMTQEFALRHPGNTVVMNMAHVGVADTGIAREMNVFLRTLIKIVGKSPERSAGNFLFLSGDINYSGYFLPKPGKPNIKEKIAYPAQVAKDLWEKSLELIRD